MKTLENLRSTHIIYLKADLDYTTYHLIDGRKNVSSFTLKKYEQKQELGAFFRVSKSCLINPVSIKNCQFQSKKASIELSNGENVQVSRRKIGLVKELMKA